MTVIRNEHMSIDDYRLFVLKLEKEDRFEIYLLSRITMMKWYVGTVEK